MKNVRDCQTLAFTLIELLVVIAIIAILAAILFPVFAQAKTAAKGIVNISNARQLSMAVQLYAMDRGGYPMMSSLSSQSPWTRWPDYIYPYVKSEAIFQGPLAPNEMFGKAFVHNPDVEYGGHGYNYQYLGNSRIVPGDPNFPFTASSSRISHPSETIAIADTQGVRGDDGELTGGQYVIDPPLPSMRGSGKSTGYYASPSACGSGTPDTLGEFGCRATPAEWRQDKVTVAWADGHATAEPRQKLDDYNGDGEPDNGFYNGQADAEQL